MKESNRFELLWLVAPLIISLLLMLYGIVSIDAFLGALFATVPAVIQMYFRKKEINKVRRMTAATLSVIPYISSGESFAADVFLQEMISHEYPVSISPKIVSDLFTKLIVSLGNHPNYEIRRRFSEALPSFLITFHEHKEIMRTILNAMNNLRYDYDKKWGPDIRRRIIESLYLASLDKDKIINCLLYTSPSPRDRQKSRMPSSA